MKPILIVKAGTTYLHIKNRYGDFEDWIISATKYRRAQFQIYDAQDNNRLPSIETCTGIIITGSHAMVTDKSEWIYRVVDWIAEAVKAKTPVLGICFGHQLLAKAMGGKVDFNSRGREIGCPTVYRTEDIKNDLLFDMFPREFKVLEAHQQSVIDLPDSAKVLAYNQHDPYQAFVIKDTAWGVQFHPEFNKETILAYIAQLNEQLANEGFNVSSLKNSIKETKLSQSILKRFCEIITEK